jgi:hypothetical protein
MGKSSRKSDQGKLYVWIEISVKSIFLPINVCL